MTRTSSEGDHVMVAGANRGIGLGLTRALLAKSSVGRVFAACRAPDRAASLHDLAAEHVDRLFLVTLDVTDEASIAAAARTVRAQVPHLHLLINTIGVLHSEQLKPERQIESVNLADLQQSFALNAFGPILLAKHFRQMLSHDQRAVFASLSARVGSIGDNRLGGWYAYRSSKAAQNQMVRTMAIEMRRRAPNMICVLLHPGTVDTDLSRPFQSGVADGRLFNVAFASAKLLEVVDGLAGEHSGRFFSWDGNEVPW